MTPSSTATLASMTPSGDTTLPPRMTRSAIVIPSQHRPAAVDRQVDAGDLARHVARQEQAGIGDVDIAGYPPERVIGRVAPGCLLDREGEAGRHLGAALVPKGRAVGHAGAHARSV